MKFISLVYKFFVCNSSNKKADNAGFFFGVVCFLCCMSYVTFGVFPLTGPPYGTPA